MVWEEVVVTANQMSTVVVAAGTVHVNLLVEKLTLEAICAMLLKVPARIAKMLILLEL